MLRFRLFHQQLPNGLALPPGNLLHFAFIKVPLRCRLVHLPALGGQLMHEPGDRRLFRLPHRLDLLPLRVIQLQLVRDVTHRAKVVTPSVTEASMPSPRIRPGNRHACHHHQHCCT
jgi:hypothetical protein